MEMWDQVRQKQKRGFSGFHALDLAFMGPALDSVLLAAVLMGGVLLQGEAG